MMDFETLLHRVLEWRGLDGDGITDPLRGDIVAALASPAPESGKLLEGVQDTDERDASRIFLEEFNKRVPLHDVEEICGKGIMSVLFYLRAFEKYLAMSKKEG